MGGFVFPWPVCSTRDWVKNLDAGTLILTASPNPGVLGVPTQSITALRPLPGAATCSVGGTPPMAQRLRLVPDLRPPIGSPTSPSAAPQAATTPVASECAFLSPQEAGDKSARELVRAPQQAFDRLRGTTAKASFSAPRSVAKQRWPGGSELPAIELDIQIGTQTIKLVRPTPKDEQGKNLPTNPQLAEALRALPPAQRTTIETVVLSPRPAAGPPPPPGKFVGGDGGGGVIDLYPAFKPQTQEDFDNRVMHEAGHNYQEKVWGNGPDGFNGWVAEAKKDGRKSVPSLYATETGGDDFCEFLIIYNTSKGTPCEEAAKLAYPNRWKKMASYE